MWQSFTACDICLWCVTSVIYVNGNWNFDSINGNENGNEKITKNGNETEMEKFDTETDKFGYVRFCFRCISISRHHAGFM